MKNEEFPQAVALAVASLLCDQRFYLPGTSGAIARLFRDNEPEPKPENYSDWAEHHAAHERWMDQQRDKFAVKPTGGHAGKSIRGEHPHA